MPVTTQTPRLTNLSYEDLRAWTNLVGGDVDKYIDAINAGGYDVSDLQAVEDLASGYMDFYKNGDGTYTVTQFKDAYQNVITNPIDSNVSTTSRGNISQMLNRGVDSITGKLNITKFPASGSFASRASYVVGSVGSAIGAVSAGIALGKTIDSALYNANPDFWDSLGLSSINPDTWNSITNGDDSNFAGLFNLILGLDPDTGNTQAYMDENAFAYMAYALAQNGIFAETTNIATANENTSIAETTPNELSYRDIEGVSAAYEYHSSNVDSRMVSSNSYAITQDGSSPVYVVGVYNVPYYSEGSAYYRFIYLVSRSPIIEIGYTQTTTNLRTGAITTRNYNINRDVVNSYWKTLSDGSRAYVMPETSFMSYSSTSDTWISNIPFNAEAGTDLRNVASSFYLHDIAELIYLGSQSQHGGVEGIGNQPDATLPNISSWDDIPSTLQSLQNQYPDMFANPLVWDNVQPDGTNPQLRYIPVPMPSAISNTDTQPISGTQTQTQTVVNPDTSTDTLIKLITELATKTQTNVDPSIPPQNPVDTGTGDSPTPLPPSGSASALWSVYHPTQAQVNSFGAWLWTDNIITQIQQVLQNPMEGIITLHKVFAMPVDSGNGTIVVGRLDSQVSSATVTQQYVTVDCGSVDCLEYFGNVFDYSPHTNISLYLPFIGIVPLNIDDVMRSNIHVIYGVDVFTGACLAMVEITRDGNTVNMYQYSGVASVEYPLTGSVHSGLITGLLGVAGSIAATVATGGVTAPAAVAAVGGLASAGKSQNARASGFSGNAGAMGIKIPYLIIERPQTKVAQTFPELAGYPTNYSCKLSDCSNHVVVKHVHVEGINATDTELTQITTLLKSGVIV